VLNEKMNLKAFKDVKRILIEIRNTREDAKERNYINTIIHNYEYALCTVSDIICDLESMNIRLPEFYGDMVGRDELE